MVALSALTLTWTSKGSVESPHSYHIRQKDMLAETTEVAESRRSLQVMQADLDIIEERLQRTNRRFIQSAPSAWARARATTAIYLANIKIQSRFKFWLLPDQD